MTDIWQVTDAADHVREVDMQIQRIVENQEQSATAALVDNLEKQHVLEQMLEASKPSIDIRKRHYLISTPFRYPPLRNGSRFGTKFEPSLFYGSKEVATVLAECAYYRFVFLSGMKVQFEETIQTSHTVFSVAIYTSSALDLTLPPFTSYQRQISSPNEYHISQALGLRMRENAIDAFLFASARCEGTNIGIFDIEAIRSNKPEGSETWLCQTNEYCVSFKCLETSEVKFFSIENFLVKGELPAPAV